jgi:hypothetical protein
MRSCTRCRPEIELVPVAGGTPTHRSLHPAYGSTADVPSSRRRAWSPLRGSETSRRSRPLSQYVIPMPVVTYQVS